MKVQLYDNVYDVPDALADKSDDEIAAFIQQQSKPKEEPSFGTYLTGALQTGGAKLFETTGNIANLLGMEGIEKLSRAREAEAKSFKDYQAVHEAPPTSMAGQLAFGLAEFAPQMPLYAAGGGVGTAALKGLGRVGVPLAEKIATMVAPRAGAGLIEGTARVAGHGALSGAVVGAAGATPGATLMERGAKSLEEAGGFALGAAGFSLAFKVLAKGLSMATGKAASRFRNNADIDAALAKEGVREKILEDADLANALKEYETVRDAQAATDVEYKDAQWLRENQPFGQTYEGTIPGGEPPPGPVGKVGGRASWDTETPVVEAGKPAPSDQSLVKGAEPIPDFKGTADAMRFGIANPSRVAEMQALHAELVAKMRDPATPLKEKELLMGRVSKLSEAAQAGQGVFGSIPESFLNKNPDIKAAVEAAKAKGIDQTKPPAPVATPIEGAQVPGIPVEPAPAAVVPKAAKAPKAEQPIDPSKKFGMKYVPDDIAIDLAHTGATRAEVQGIVDGIVKKPMTDLAVRRELANRGHDVEDLKKMKPEDKRDALNRELVEEALDAEIAKRGQGLTPEQRSAPVETTPQLDIQARILVDKKRAFEAKIDKLKKSGMKVEEISAMTPEQVHTKHAELLNKDAADAIAELTKRKPADKGLKGLEKAEQTLNDAKALELDGDLAPSRLELIQLKVIEQKLAKRDAEASAPAEPEPTRRQRRTPEEDKEIEEWLSDTTLDLKEPAVVEDIPNVPTETKPTVELKTAEDFEALLKSEGMGADLPGEGGGFTLDFMGLQQMYEMARDIFKRDINKDTLSLVGRGLFLEGPKEFPAFKKRMEEIAGPAWPAIKGNIGDLFEQSKAWHTNLTENGILTYHGTKVFFMPNERGEIGYDLRYAGTGEGAAYRGWGIYTTKKVEIAESNYAERLARKANEREGVSGERTIMIGDRPLSNRDLTQIYGYTIGDVATLLKMKDPKSIEGVLTNKAVEFGAYLERQIEGMKHSLDIGRKLERGREQAVQEGRATPASLEAMRLENRHREEAYKKEIAKDQAKLDALNEFSKMMYEGNGVKIKEPVGAKYKAVVYETRHLPEVEEKLLNLDTELKPEQRTAIVGALDKIAKKETKGGDKDWLADLVDVPTDLVPELRKRNSQYIDGLITRDEYKQFIHNRLKQETELLDILRDKADVTDPLWKASGYKGMSTYERITLRRTIESYMRFVEDQGPDFLFKTDSRVAQLRDVLKSEETAKAGADVTVDNDGLGLPLAYDIESPHTQGKIIAEAGQILTQNLANGLSRQYGISNVRVAPSGIGTERVVRIMEPKGKMTGHDVQYKLWEIFGNGDTHATGARKATSEFLRDEAGIPGNKFVSQGGGAETYVWFDPKHAQPVREYTLDSLGLQQTYEGLRDMVKRGRLHPAVYPQGIQKLMGDLASGLQVKTVLDIFGGTGRIGKIKEYGYDGKVIANELEPAWGGVRTTDLHKTNGVDVSIIGDARKIDLPNESVGAIMTSPTYGNEMARTGASRTESYQAFAGGELKEGNTGGMIWGPEYEALHKEAYKEAFRVVEPGGYFVLNMKDRFKSDRIPKANSTVAVEGGVMKATDWHTKALEAEGFKFVKQYKVEEGFATSAAHEVKRRNTVGYEDVVVLQKPVADGPSPYGSGVTFDFMGGQQATEALYKLWRRTRDGKTTLGSDKLKEALLGKDGKEWLHDRLPDPDAIRVWESEVRQPMRIAQKIGGKAFDFVTRWNMADLSSVHKFAAAGGDRDVLNAIFGQLDKAGRLELGKVVENKAKASSEKVATAAGQLRDWLDMMWDEKIATTKADFKSHLKPEEYEALMQVIEKKYSPETIFSKFDEKDAHVLRGLVDDFRALESKYIPDYMTHFERGSIVLRDKEVGGKVVAVGVSKADAIRKAQRIKEADPSAELYMDTNFMKDMPQGIGQGQYFSVLKRLSDSNDKILKEINEGIAKGESTLAAKRAVRGLFIIKPTYKFSAFEKRRFDTLAGEEDVSSVLFNYAYTMRRKTALDPLIAEARGIINRDYAGQPNTQEFLRTLIEDTKGRYHWQDKAADDLIRWIGRETGIERMETASMTATKGAAYARAAEGILKLAYRPIAAAFNYLGGQGNVWTQNGTKYFSAGYKFLASKEGKQFIKEMEPIMGQTFAHEGESLKPRHEVFKGLPWWTQPMGMFERPEIPNRSIGLAAPYLMARDSVKNGGLGMGEAEARIYAFQQNVFSQATYNIANLPSILRSPVGKTMGQFKTYMINQLEFMAHLSAPQAGRFLMVQAALGGPRAIVAMLKAAPVLAMFGWWGEIEQWMDKNYPRASRGVGGMLGIDVTGPAALQMPQSMSDWAGPFISDIVKTYNNVLKSYMAGEKMAPRTFKEGVEFSTSIAEQVSPLMKTWPKLLIDKMATPGQNGYIIKDQRGREIYRLENVDIAKVVMGAEPLEAARIKQFESREKQHAAQLSKRKAYVTDAVVDALNAGEVVPPHVWDEMFTLGIRSSTIRREMKMRMLSPEARRIIQTEMLRRGEIMEEFPKPAQ
jgi:hypothetical protein